MTEREVSSERDDSAFLRGMALAYATDDNEHSQKGAARLREIADNILALRSSVKTMGTCDSLREAAEAVCRKLESESETASITIFDQEALRSALSAIEAPAAASEVTEDWIRDTAMNVMLATEVEEAIRILTAALKGDRP